MPVQAKSAINTVVSSLIKTCNWSGIVSTGGSGAEIELCECEKLYFYPCERGSRTATVQDVPSSPPPSYNLEGLFLQINEEAMAFWNTFRDTSCTGIWLSSHSCVESHCNESRWKQREGLGCSSSLSVRLSFLLTSFIKDAIKEHQQQFLFSVPLRVLFWRSSSPLQARFPKLTVYHWLPVTSDLGRTGALARGEKI